MAKKKFSLNSIVSNKLTHKEIKQICLLKDKQWKPLVRGALLPGTPIILLLTFKKLHSFI